MGAFARIVVCGVLCDASAFASECGGSAGTTSFRRPYVRATRRGGEAEGGESDIVNDGGGKSKDDEDESERALEHDGRGSLAIAESRAHGVTLNGHAVTGRVLPRVFGSRRVHGRASTALISAQGLLHWPFAICPKSTLRSAVLPPYSMIWRLCR